MEKLTLHLSDLFLERLTHFSGKKQPHSAPKLEACLQAILAQVKQAWPTLAISAEQFLDFLAMNAPSDCAHLQWLEQAHSLLVKSYKGYYMMSLPLPGHP